MAMSNQHRRILEKAAPDILTDLDVIDVLPYLLADGVITRNDEEKINSKSTRWEKNGTLMDIIPRRGAGAYVSFLNSLLKTEGSVHLYESIKNLEQEEPVDSSNNLPVSRECTDSISTAHMSGCKLDTAVFAQLDLQRPANSDRALKDADFLELSKGLGMHWEALALRLGLSRAEVYQCKENNKYNQQSQTFDMLYKWKCKNGRHANVGMLLKACQATDGLDGEAYEYLYNL